MMAGARIARDIALCLAALILFLVLVYAFFPVHRVTAVINQALSAQGLNLAPEPRKSIFPGLVWNNAVLASDQGALVRCASLKARPLLLPLFLGRTVLHCAAAIGAGKLDLDCGLTGREALTLTAERIRLEEIPFFQTVLAAKAAGTLQSSGRVRRDEKGLNGDIQLEVKQLGLSGVKLGSFALPDVSGLTAVSAARPG